MNAEKEKQLLELLTEYCDTYNFSIRNIEDMTVIEIMGLLYFHNFKSLL